MILTKPKSVNAGPISGRGEGVAHSKRRYVALVRMHHENKVSERLSKIGIDSFVPLQQQIHQWSDRRKMVDTVSVSYTHLDVYKRQAICFYENIFIWNECYILNSNKYETDIFFYLFVMSLSFLMRLFGYRAGRCHIK